MTKGNEETGAAQVPEVQPQDIPLPSTDDGYRSDGSMDDEDVATRGKDGAANEQVAKWPQEESAADGDAKNLGLAGDSREEKAP